MAYAARINSLINEEIEDSLSSIDSNDERDEDYGNTGCRDFKWGGTKLEIFAPINQHTQRKLFHFKNWSNGKV